MTTALKSLYVQIEMPNDTNQRSTSTTVLNWTIDYSGTADPDRAVGARAWSGATRPPAVTAAGNRATCRGGAVVPTGAFKGTSELFQRLLGFTPQLRDADNTTMCDDHPSKPLFTAQDLSDWAWVTIAPKASPADRTPVIQPYDLPALRAATTLTLSLPRFGFYTTPAFLALWNTNDSNQHRVTANQALLVALGQAFTAENTGHAVLDGGPRRHARRRGQRMSRLPRDAGPDAPVLGEPARLQRPQRLPAPAAGNSPGNPRPTGALVNEFAFGDIRGTGASIAELGNYLDPGDRRRRAAALRRSRSCSSSASTRTRRRAARATRSSAASSAPSRTARFNFAVLAKEFFSSPLVTGAAATGSFPAGEVPISIARRDHLCAALSNRLGKPDLCVQAAPLPTQHADGDRPASRPASQPTRSAAARSRR